jgi:hypothetical protein
MLRLPGAYACHGYQPEAMVCNAAATSSIAKTVDLH